MQRVVLSKILLLATLAALLLQGVIPVGMMPDFASHHTAAMKMCDGMMTMPMAAKDKTSPAHKDMPCPYAMAAHLFLPLLLVMLFSSICVSAVPVPPWHVQWRKSFPIGNAGARAPPVFS